MIASEAKIRESATEINISRKRPNRQGKNDEVEDALGKWFTAVRAKKQTVTGPMLMKKAQQFGEQLGTDFSPSNGWLSRWKNRARIRFKRAHGEKSSANFEAAEEWLSTKMPELLERFNPDSVYNADETGLFYRAAPDSSQDAIPRR